MTYIGMRYIGWYRGERGICESNEKRSEKGEEIGVGEIRELIEGEQEELSG